MSDRRQDDMAAQAWPGFVDILSSTVIMFVFFVMVVVVVLYLYTIKFTATVQAQAEQRVMASLSKISNPEILENLDEAKITKIEEISRLEVKRREIENEVESLKNVVKQVSVGFSESANQEVIIQNNVLIVFFEEGAVTLTKESMDQIAPFFEENNNYSSVIIHAGDNPMAGTQTTARQRNLARMLNVRNTALKANVKPEDIQIGYVRSEEIKSSYNWVKVTLE